MELVRKRIRVLDEAMDATVVERTTFRGEVIETHVDVDHRTRLAAGDGVDDLVGLKRSKSADQKGPSGPVTYNVFIAPAPVPSEQPQVVDAEVVSSAS